MLVKVARGVFQRCVETTLEEQKAREPLVMLQQFLRGGFNPFEKYELVKMGIFPKDRGENKTYLSCHHHRFILTQVLKFSLKDSANHLKGPLEGVNLPFQLLRCFFFGCVPTFQRSTAWAIRAYGLDSTATDSGGFLLVGRITWMSHKVSKWLANGV